MKRITIILIGILFFYSCTTEEKVPYSGNLKGEIKYTGASNMEVDNVIIILRGVDGNTEKISKRISRTGEYSFDLPAGKYVLNLEGNRCYSKNLPDTIMVTTAQITTKDINIEQLASSMVILYNDIEYKSGDTIVLGSAAVLDIWNKYSSNNLKWDIRAYPQPSWIAFETTNGAVTGGGRKSVVFSIDKNKIADYGINYSDVILTTEDNGSFTIKVSTFKEGIRPEKVHITGNDENVCPTTSVILTAYAVGATSYRWFMGTTQLSGVNGNTCEVKSSGTYYAVGVNEGGDGIKSDGKLVTIRTCPQLPGQATISTFPYNAENDCKMNVQNVTLTAQADHAESYIWYRGNEQLSETGNMLVVSDFGVYTYYVKGVNVSGEGQASLGKIVTITPCPVPSNPVGVSAKLDGVNDSGIRVSWSKVASATSYKIQLCDNISMKDCEGAEYYRVTSSSQISFEESALHCGQNYFRVIAVNRFGESSGITVSCNKTVSVSAPVLFNLAGFLSWTSSNINGVNSNTVVYYDIYRKVENGGWNFVATTTGTYYTDTYSSSKGYVYYKVRAYVTTSCGVTENYSEAS